jgi:hypothetical protein
LDGRSYGGSDADGGEGETAKFSKGFQIFAGIKFEKFRRIFMLKQIELEDFIQDFFETSFTKHLLEKKKESPIHISY